MKTRAIFILSILMAAGTVRAETLDPVYILNQAHTLQSKVNALACQVSSLGELATPAATFSDANIRGVKASIANARASAQELTARLEHLRSILPTYAPKPGHAANNLKKQIDKNQKQQAEILEVIKADLAKKQELQEYLQNLIKDFQNNTLKLGVKTFMDYFDWSKGGLAGIAAKKLYAKITNTKTQYELDAATQKEFEEEIRQVRDISLKELDEKISQEQKTYEDVKTTGTTLAELSAEIDQLIAAYPDFFGSGDGLSDEALMESIRTKKAEDDKQTSQQKREALSSQNMGADQIIRALKHESENLETLSTLKKTAEDSVTAARAGSENPTVAGVDQLMQMKAKAEKQADECKALAESAQAAIPIYNAKWGALDWSNYAPETVSRYRAGYTAETEHLNASIQSAWEIHAALQAAADEISTIWQSSKARVESGAGEIEKLRGVIEGKPDTSTMQGAYFENNLPTSTIAQQAKKLEDARARAEQLARELETEQAAFSDACSYYVWYFKGRHKYEGPNAEADRVEAPYASRVYGTSDEDAPLVPAEEYERKHKAAQTARVKIEEKLLHLASVGAEIRAATGAVWSNTEVAAEGERNRKTLADLDAILKLHANIMVIAQERDAGIEENVQQAKTTRDQAETKIKAVLSKYEAFLARNMKNAELQETLDLETDLRQAPDVLSTEDKKVRELLDLVGTKKEAVLKKWAKDAQPIVRSAFVNSTPIRSDLEPLELMKDHLRGGRAMVFSGSAEPFYLTIQKQGGYDHYVGSLVQQVVVEINGTPNQAKLTNDGGYSVAWEYAYEPRQDEKLNVKIYALDNLGHTTALEDQVRVNINFAYHAVKRLVQQKLDELKAAYEAESVTGMVRQIADHYFGDRYALEQNLRAFFKTAENIRIEPVVDFAQMDGDRIIANFHWNKSFLGDGGTVVQKGYETIILDRTDRDRILKASPTLFGVYSNTVGDADGASSARSGILLLVPDAGGNLDAANMALFEDGTVFLGQPMDPYDIWAEPWGSAVILLNHSRSVGIKDLGIKSLDAVVEVPSERSSYNYDLGDSGTLLAAGHCYALTLQNKYYAAFEVLDLIAFEPWGPGSTQYKTRIAYTFQPSGTPSVK